MIAKLEVESLSNANKNPMNMLKTNLHRKPALFMVCHAVYCKYNLALKLWKPEVKSFLIKRFVGT